MPSSSGNTTSSDGGGTEWRSPFTADFEKLAKETLEKWHVPGLAIAVVDGDHVVSQGFGMATLIPDNKPVTGDTLFYAGSTTKAFTAAVLGILVEAGTPLLPTSSQGGSGSGLSWKTKIADILPADFLLSNDDNAWATAHLTLEDAVCHRTGLSRHDFSLARFYGSGPERHDATIQDVVRSLRYMPMAEEPRVKYQYCNVMFAVLSHCVEKLTGEWLGDTMRDMIWGPLKMGSTYLSLEEAMETGELATGYYWSEDRSGLDGDEDGQKGDEGEIPPMGLQEVSGAGAVISSVNDYAKWIQCLLRESEPLGKGVHEELKRPKMIVGSGRGAYDVPQMYASGWFVASYKGHRVFTHSGGMEAYGAEVYFFPDDNYGVVTLGNTAISSNAAGEILLWKLVDEKLGIPEEERYNWEAKWEGFIDDLQFKIDHAVEILYPDYKEENKTQSALKLESYAGTYYHPGYQNLTLTLGEDGKTLRSERSEFTWQNKVELEHVSGEYWVLYSTSLKAPGNMAIDGIAAVEFRIGVDGRVSKVGIEWRDTASGVVDGWIWYDRL
ncbi:penicillin-binding protein 4 [Diplogelasinospora grovesii]|uniref:Penicillin-binding protein 4 n=1 Tax=Diplogelasinospora grovesii TaxID=303347 RepID=A0AAN6NI60_9PEZI|nr:penicillin-binding protein 4 [Diplogelasinospora grovesii]